MRRSALAIIFSLCTVPSWASARVEFSNNVLVAVAYPTQVSIVSKSLPADAKAVLSEDRFILVEVKTLDLPTLRKLKQIQGVVSVRPSLKLAYAATEIMRSSSVLSQNSGGVPEVSECLQNSRCSSGERNRLWAQSFMATDLAQDFVSKKHISRTTRIAVVDSGLDAMVLDRLYPGVTVKAGGALTKEDLKIDRTGHGSRVTSLIKGRDGVGGSVASPVEFFSLGRSYNIDSGLLGLGILKACRSGNDVVNVSVSNNDNELVKMTLSDVIDEDVMGKITKTGCILIHASGNNGAFIGSDDSKPLEFEVGASNSLGKEASFSAKSEMLAPGENVFGIGPIDPKGDKTRQCRIASEIEHSFASGTSFAAPLITSTVSIVRDVAKQSPEFRKKSRADQADLLREMISQSRVDGIANAFIATQIAAEWTNQPKKSVEDAKKRFEAKSAKSCGPSFQPKCGSVSCEDAVKCEPQLREYALACSASDPDAALDLVASMQARGNVEGAAYWLRLAKNASPSQKKDLKFPLEQMKTSLAGNASRSNVVRWWNYYNQWKTSMTAAPGAQAALMVATAATLKDAGRRPFDENDQSARAEITQLFVEAKKSDPSFVTVEWAKGLLGNPGSAKLAIAVLISAQRDGLVSSREMLDVADSSLKDTANKDAVSNAVDLLTSQKLDMSTRVSYAKKILSNRKISNEDIGKATSLVSPQNMSDWLNVRKIAADHPQMDSEMARDLALPLHMYASSFSKAERTQALKVIDALLLKATTEEARAPIDIVRAEIDGRVAMGQRGSWP